MYALDMLMWFLPVLLSCSASTATDWSKSRQQSQVWTQSSIGLAGSISIPHLPLSPSNGVSWPASRMYTPRGRAEGVSLDGTLLTQSIPSSSFVGSSTSLSDNEANGFGLSYVGWAAAHSDLNPPVPLVQSSQLFWSRSHDPHSS